VQSRFSIYRTIGTLAVLAVGLLLLSGIPAFKNADHGWKFVAGGIGWFGFLLTAAAALVLSAVAVARRNRPQGS